MSDWHGTGLVPKVFKVRNREALTRHHPLLRVANVARLYQRDMLLQLRDAYARHGLAHFNGTHLRAFNRKCENGAVGVPEAFQGGQGDVHYQMPGFPDYGMRLCKLILAGGMHADGNVIVPF